jgi:ferredoxin
VFCAAVCPHGVLQDLFLLRPVRLPRWLDTALGVVPAIYLGIAVLSATLGGAFLVCRWDPLVPLMRLSGITPMALAGIALLVVSLFVGRPYCRFLCPLGVVLGWFSRVAWRPVTITPDECVRCRLCEDACPFGAIRTPVPADLARDRVAGRKRLVLAMAVLPLLVAAGGAAGWTAGRVFLRTHPTARMAEQALREERANDREGGAATRALRAAGLTADDLRARVASMSRRYRVGGTLFGAGAALCVGATLVGAGTRHGGGDYVPDRRLCVACGRCFACCPREWVRRRGRPAVAAVQPATDDGGRA